MKKNKEEKKKKEFSKVLVGQESILIWIMTISFIVLAFICIDRQYFGELPWLTAMVGFPWTAYGVSQAFYYNKAKRENELKIKKQARDEGIPLPEDEPIEFEPYVDVAAEPQPGFGESFEEN